MKKISALLFLFLITLSLTSCSKIKEYDEESSAQFIEKIYDYINKDKAYLLIDARTIEDYAKGHFFGFVSYDIVNGNLDEFKYKIESMHSKDKAIFIVDGDGSSVEDLADVLKDAGYKKIYIYLDGYNTLNNYNNNDFKIVTGTEDCEC